MDDRLLSRWRSRLLVDWVAKNIELRYFREAINANSLLPKETVQGMLETLPAMGDSTDQGMSSDTREAIAVFVSFIHACRTDAIVFRTAGYAIGGCSLVSAATLFSWRPLFGMAALAPIPLIRNYVKNRRLCRAKESFVKTQTKPGFDSEIYLNVISQFHRSPEEQISLMDLNAGETP